MGRFDFVNVRAGPAIEFEVIGRFNLGQICPIIGRTPDETWLQIECEGGFTGWVQSNVVTIQGDPNSTSILVAPTPTVAPIPTPTPIVFRGWRTSYFSNRDLAGSPVVVVDSPEINFDWGTGSPHPLVPATNFSARFERTVNLPAGNYRFSVRVDDGVRVWLDNMLILDDWRESTARDLYVDQSLAAGDHQLRVEYFQAGGSALIRTAYAMLANTDDWLASYYNNGSLSGTPPVQQLEARTAYPLDRNWGTASPIPGVINNTNWSGRWQGRFFFEPGTYVFSANSDDGVRVFIDGQRVIDGWTDGLKQMSNRFNGVGQGEHEITVEFYQRTGNALVRVSWYRDTSIQEQ
ncbi:MAG: SH3 domain-containing protein [Caldilineaceae bacterium]|nr:SH3 domain-containing protein [Caldilineaceae bacterium]